jgi:nicotinamide riboside kinase
MGASCSGKSTLVEAIHKKYPMLTIIREIAGTFTAAERNVFNFQEMIQTRQIEAETEFSNGFVSDRTVMDNMAYLLWYYKAHGMKNSQLLCRCFAMFDKHMKSHPYDTVFFVDEYFVLEDNGIRCLNHKQQEESFRMLQNIAELYCNVYSIPLVFIKGSTEERIKTIESHVALE